MVTQEREEAKPIARLLGADGKRKIGLVYLWNTGELSFLWIEKQDTAKFIEPPLSQETLATAKAVSSDAVTDFLVALSIARQECPE